MSQKKSNEFIFHVVVSIKLMAKNVMQNKNGIIKSVDANTKN